MHGGHIAMQHNHAYYIALEQLIIPAFEVVTFSTRGGTSGNFDIWVRSRGLIASGGYIELANSRVGWQVPSLLLSGHLSLPAYKFQITAAGSRQAQTPGWPAGVISTATATATSVPGSQDKQHSNSNSNNNNNNIIIIIINSNAEHSQMVAQQCQASFSDFEIWCEWCSVCLKALGPHLESLFCFPSLNSQGCIHCHKRVNQPRIGSVPVSSISVVGWGKAQAVAGTALMSSIEVVGVVWDIIF